jgi:hypothetical protein
VRQVVHSNNSNNYNALGNSKIGTPFLLSQKPRPISLFR